MKRVLLLAAIGLLAGCGPDQARITGRVVENGQPVEVQGQAALVFYPDAGGKPGDRAYPAGLNPDGTFELVASGGSLPPGVYLVSLEVNGPKTNAGIGRFKDQYKLARWELKPGQNDLTIDLAKPGG